MIAIMERHKRLKEIEFEIREARRRLPAHSIKPVLMQALFELEDERCAILEQLRALPPEGSFQTPGNPLSSAA